MSIVPLVVTALACDARIEPASAPAGSLDAGLRADATADAATVEQCLSSPPPPAPCNAGCFDQLGYILNDTSTCTYPVRLYCGRKASSGDGAVRCWVRLSDGVVLIIPSLSTIEPPSLFRECTEQEYARVMSSGVHPYRTCVDAGANEDAGVDASPE